MAVHRRADRFVIEPARLEAVGISKRFGEVLALDGAHCRFSAGSLHALLGENGAGKTSLMRIVFGMLIPDTGSLFLNGQPLLLRSPADAIRHGIAMVHQHFSLVPGMTAIENFALGGHGRFNRPSQAQRLKLYSEQLHMSLDPDIRADEMSAAEQQQLEIAKALGRECHILILDEPTAVLPPPQASALLHLIRAFATAGRSIVLITHKVREAMAVADSVTVLRQGRTVLTSDMKAVDEQSLLTAMLGAAPPSQSEVSLKREHQEGVQPLATLLNVSAEDSRTREVLVNVSLDVRPGEIIGIAGLERSGHRLLLRVLAGRHQAARGSVLLPSSIGFIPEDRTREALALALDLRENVALRDAGRRRGWIKWRQWSNSARSLIREYEIKAPSEHVAASMLSGGNQQKLVVGRELSAHPSLIVAENPTRGLDSRATQDVHQRFRHARDEGCAVVFYSSDLDELTGEADRVLVVYAGHVRQPALTRDSIGRALIGSM